jgi:hypothetical protein
MKVLASEVGPRDGLPGEPLYGFVPDAGVARNFRRAAERAPA